MFLVFVPRTCQLNHKVIDTMLEMNSCDLDTAINRIIKLCQLFPMRDHQFHLTETGYDYERLEFLLRQRNISAKFHVKTYKTGLYSFPLLDIYQSGKGDYVIYSSAVFSLYNDCEQSKCSLYSGLTLCEEKDTIEVKRAISRILSEKLT